MKINWLSVCTFSWGWEDTFIKRVLIDLCDIRFPKSVHVERNRTNRFFFSRSVNLFYERPAETAPGAVRWIQSKVYEGVSKIFRTDAVNLTTKRVWKLPTSTQLRATRYTESLDMVVLPSTGASRYHNCCIAGGTSPDSYRASNDSAKYMSQCDLIGNRASRCLKSVLNKTRKFVRTGKCDLTHGVTGRRSSPAVCH
jgi:hypothetical protein